MEKTRRCARGEEESRMEKILRKYLLHPALQRRREFEDGEGPPHIAASSIHEDALLPSNCRRP
jgi:hypothetical protein